MIALLACALAFADPVALRAPVAAPGVTVGRHALSGVLPLPESWWLAAEVATSGSAVGASVGRRWILARGARGWGLDATVAGGVTFPTGAPGVALTTTPSVMGGYFGDRFAITGGLALPLAAGFAPDLTARLPALLELQPAWRVGRVWVGLVLGAGAIFTPGLDTSVVLEPALWIGWARARTLEGESP